MKKLIGMVLVSALLLTAQPLVFGAENHDNLVSERANVAGNSSIYTSSDTGIQATASYSSRYNKVSVAVSYTHLDVYKRQIKTGETINYTENFDKYLSEGQNEAELEISGGSALTVNGNIAATTNGGYVRVRQVSADHGASGITGTEDGMTVTGGGPYLGFITNAATETLRVKCEIYFSSLDINGEVNTRGVNSSGAASHMKHFEIVKDQMKVYNGTTVANTIQLTAGEWHTFEYVPDFTNKTYDFYWDGEKIASNYAFRDPDFKQVMNNIRIHMNHAGHTEGFTAIDNMQLSTIIKYPYVTEISNVGTASGSANLVDYNTEQFKVQMTGEFESVDASQVSLFAEDVYKRQQLERGL